MDTVGSYDKQRCLAVPNRFRIVAIAGIAARRMVATKRAVMQNVCKARAPRDALLKGVQPYRPKMYPKVEICMSSTATRKLVDSLCLNSNASRRGAEALPYKHIQSPRIWTNQRFFRSLSTNVQFAGSLYAASKPLEPTGEDVTTPRMSTMPQPQVEPKEEPAELVDLGLYDEAALESAADPLIGENEQTDPYWNIHDIYSQSISEGNSPNAFDAEDHEVTWKWKH